MDDPEDLLRAYDDQLRTDAETPSALSVARSGPLRLVTFAGGRGFVTYRNLDGADADAIADLVAQAVAHFDADPGIREVEWKTRGHDAAPGLHETLLAHGFEPEEEESIMIGPLAALVDAPTPAGVELERVTAAEDIRAASFAADRAFGEEPDAARAASLVARLEREADRSDGMQMWIARAEGRIVCAGRLEPVPGTEFAGIWGGATLPAFRRRGIYRALTAARARAAVDMGRRLVHSDSTAYSRPILERSGLRAVSTTTPYVRRRPVDVRPSRA